MTNLERSKESQPSAKRGRSDVSGAQDAVTLMPESEAQRRWEVTR